MIREDLQLNKPIEKENKYFISIPGENLHFGQLTGTTGVFSQKLDPEVSLKIVDMVQSGITDVKEIKCSLKYYVNTSLCRKLGPILFQVIGHFIYSVMKRIIMLPKPKENFNYPGMTKITCI